MPDVPPVASLTFETLPEAAADEEAPSEELEQPVITIAAANTAAAMPVNFIFI